MESLKVFVGGLAQHTTKESMNQYFQQFGQADSYVMVDGATGRSRGFGFVNFAEEAVVQGVLQMQHDVDGVLVSVSPYQGKSGGGKGVGGKGLGGGAGGGLGGVLKVFVGGLSQNSTRDSLNQYFGQFGFADSFVMVDKATGRSRGFGFVNFREDSVMNAVLAQQHEVDGVAITVSAYADKGQGKGAARPAAAFGGFAAPAPAPVAGAVDMGALATTLAATVGGGDPNVTSSLLQLLATPELTTLLTQVQQQAMGGAVAAAPMPSLAPAFSPRPAAITGGGTPLKIFVGGLSQNTTKESLNQYFQQFGQADSIIMMDKASGRSRGFGFVDFQDENVMNTVLQYSHQVDGVIVNCTPYGSKSGAAADPAGAVGGSNRFSPY